jgi:hypothetical protein
MKVINLFLSTNFPGQVAMGWYVARAKRKGKIVNYLFNVEQKCPKQWERN